MNSSATMYPAKSPMPATYGGRGPAAAPAAYSTQATRYRDAELLSATPGQLVVMLFDKTLLTLRRARLACEARRIEERCDQIVKASEMITELRACLDFEQGGDIARQLDALYGFMLRELLVVNRTQEAARLDPVIRVATDLRDAFAQIATAKPAGLPAARIA